MQSIILGATGIVGGFIKDKLIGSGERPFALSRNVREDADGAIWFRGDLTLPDGFKLPPSDVLYSTVHPLILARALDRIITPSLKRVIFFTSTSIVTKLDSLIPAEQSGIRKLAEGENELQRKCREHNLYWTALRPTIIYAEGRDVNLTRLAGFIRRFKFLPLSGRGDGLRQPVHGEDLATGAIAAASSSLTHNKIYALPGKDLITYREMVGRIFDSLGQSRVIIPLPPAIWKLAFTAVEPFFPNANAAMGERMSKDMVFDGNPASKDFGWNPRPFQPRFDRHRTSDA